MPFLGPVSIEGPLGSPRRQDREGREDMCCGHQNSPHPPLDRHGCASTKVKDFPWAVTYGERDHIELFCWDRRAANARFSYKTSLHSSPQRLWSALRTQDFGLPCRSSLMVGAQGPGFLLFLLFLDFTMTGHRMTDHPTVWQPGDDWSGVGQ